MRVRVRRMVDAKRDLPRRIGADADHRYTLANRAHGGLLFRRSTSVDPEANHFAPRPSCEVKPAPEQHSEAPIVAGGRYVLAVQQGNPFADTRTGAVVGEVQKGSVRYRVTCGGQVIDPIATCALVNEHRERYANAPVNEALRATDGPDAIPFADAIRKAAGGKGPYWSFYLVGRDEEILGGMILILQARRALGKKEQPWDACGTARRIGR